MTHCRTTPPPRVIDRPDSELWDQDELMTLPEAVALFWPRGPLTVRSLRTAIRDDRLPVSVVAGRHLVTRRALKEMSRCTILGRHSAAQRATDREQPGDPGPSPNGAAAYRRLLRELDQN